MRIREKDALASPKPCLGVCLQEDSRPGCFGGSEAAGATEELEVAHFLHVSSTYETVPRLGFPRTTVPEPIARPHPCGHERRKDSSWRENPMVFSLEAAAAVCKAASCSPLPHSSPDHRSSPHTRNTSKEMILLPMCQRDKRIKEKKNNQPNKQTKNHFELRKLKFLIFLEAYV